MGKVLVSGLINIETTLKVPGFPIDYTPVNYPFFGVGTSVSGVGLNVGKALKRLGDDVHLLSLIGRDYEGEMAMNECQALGLDTRYLKKELDETAKSVILYEESGRRQIYVDLKNLQELSYPEDSFREALVDCSLAVLCNINFSRKLLSLTKAQGVKIATDVHVLRDLNDSYNADFMSAADILFMSHEGQIGHEKDFVQKVAQTYNNEIIVMGMGAEGALLYVKKDQSFTQFPSVLTRPIVNTIGAGDALFSSFIHYFNKTNDPYSSLKKAIVYASWKIGEKGAAQGLLTLEGLENLIREKGFSL